MNCREIQDRLAEGGKVAAGDLEIQQHLAGCEACRTLAKRLAEVDQALADLEPKVPPRALVNRTLEAVESKSRKRPWFRRPAWVTAFSLFAVVTVAIGVGMTTLRMSGGMMAGAPPVEVPPDRFASFEIDDHLGRGLVGDTKAISSETFRALDPSAGQFDQGLDAVPRSGETNGWLAEKPTDNSEDSENDKLGDLERKVDALKVDVSQSKARLQLLHEQNEAEKVPAADEQDQDGERDRRDTKAQNELATQARIAPSFHDGRPSGFKVFAIKPNSDLAKAGLKNGDEIVTIDGKDVTLPEKALEAYNQRTDGTFKVELRRGEHTIVMDLPVQAIKGEGGESTGRWGARRDKAENLKQALEGLSFIEPRGYFANTYLPGDPELEWLRAKLAAGLLLDGQPLALERAARPYRQPFDAPAQDGLAIYLTADTAGLEGPTRLTLQVGLKGSEQHARRRASLNAALVVDLTAIPSEDARALLWAIGDGMAASLQAGDRFSLVVAGVKDPLRVKSARFELTEVRRALAAALGEIEQGGVQGDLASALASAYQAVRGEGALDAPLGANQVLVASAAPALQVPEALARTIHAEALMGIPLSGLGAGAQADLQALGELAQAGQGRRRLVRDRKGAADLVVEELAASGRVVARAVRLSIKLADGVKLVSVLGSHPLSEERSQRVRQMETAIDQRVARSLGIEADRGQDEDGIQIVIPAYYAGDEHVILLDVVAPGPGALLEVRARYKDLVNLKNALAQASLTLPAGARPVGRLNLSVSKSVLAHGLAADLLAAARAIDGGDLAAARARLDGATRAIQSLAGRSPALAGDKELSRDLGMLSAYTAFIDNHPRWQANPQAREYLVYSLAYAARMKTAPGGAE